MTTFEVTVGPKLPSDSDPVVFRVDGRVTTGVFRTQLPGGYLTAEIGMRLDPRDGEGAPLAFLPRTGDVPHHGHGEIRIGTGVVFEGRVVVRRLRAAGVAGFTLRGYGVHGLNDNPFAGGGADTTTGERLLAMVLGQTTTPCRLIAPGTLPSGFHAPKEMRDKTPAEVLQQLVAEAGYGYTVYASRALTLVPNTVASADYSVPFDDRIVTQWDEDSTECFGGARMRIGDGDGDVTADYYRSGSLAAGSRFRALSGAGSDLAAAEAYVNAWLDLNSMPKITAQLVFKDWTRVPTANGGVREPYLVRAGEAVQVGNQAPQRITATSFDVTTGQLTVTLGQPAITTLAGMIQLATEVAVDAKNSRHPLTKARTF